MIAERNVKSCEDRLGVGEAYALSLLIEYRAVHDRAPGRARLSKI